jgi:hypothetical protein
VNISQFWSELGTAFSHLLPKGLGELNGSLFYIFNQSGSEKELDFDQLYKVYRTVPHLNIVINEKAKLFSNGIFRVKKRDSEDEILFDHPLQKTLDNPNPFQSLKEFLFMVQVYQCIEGDAFIKKNYTLGNKSRNLASLVPIDFQKKEIHTYRNVAPFEAVSKKDLIRKIEFWIGEHNLRRSFEGDQLDEIIHFRDAGVFFDEALSKIQVHKEVIVNIYKALKARQTMIQRKGGIGALTGNQKDAGMAIPMKPDEKKDIQRRLDNYGLGIGQDPLIVTDVPMKWQPFVYPTRELMLFEEVQDGFHTLCDAFGVKRELFEGQSNFSNKEHAERGTYQDTIIPLWNSFANKLNSELNTEAEGVEIFADYSHIQILQEDEKLKIDTQRAKSDMLLNELDRNLISGETYLEQMGYEDTKLPELSAEAPKQTGEEEQEEENQEQ